MALDESILGGSVPFDPSEVSAAMVNRLSDQPVGTPVDTDIAIDRMARKVLGPRPEPVAAPTSKASDPSGMIAKPDLSHLGVPLDQATGDLDRSGLPDLSFLGEPLDKLDVTAEAMPSVQGAGPQAAKPPNAIMRGFVTGLLKENPESAAEALEGMSHLAPKDFKDALGGASKDMHRLSKLSPEEYAKKGGSMWDIKGLDDAMTWAGETLGGGLASTVPSVAGGVVGGVAGGRIAGKTGAIVGATAGASVPSAVLNYGQVYKALKEEKVEPEKAAEYAAWATVPMTALDTASIGPIIGRLGGITEVKAQLARAIAKRIAEETAKGAGREGITEGLQDLVQSATVSLASDKPFWTVETAKSAVENMAGGALVGGVMGAGSGIKPDNIAPTPAAQPAPGAPSAAPGAGPSSSGPGPQPGPQPGPGPQGGPQAGPGVSPEAEDFIKKAQAAPNPDQGPDLSAMSEAEKLHAYAASRESHDGAREADILKTAGFSDEQIARMSDEARVDAVIRAAKPKAGDQTGTPGPDAAAKAAKPSPEDEEYSILRAGGYTDDNIADMSPGQRASEAAYYRDDLGINPAEAMKRHPRPQAETGKDGKDQKDQINDPNAGARTAPIKAQTADDVLRVSSIVADPTEPQAQAENYKHGHLDIEPLGLTGRSNVSIETGVGGTRRGTGPDGKPWEVKMPVAYGRIKGTKGADGEPLDIFIGPNPASTHVFVIDQHHPGGKGFDEHKIMSGFVNPRAALEAFKASYTDQGGDRIGHVVAMSADEFKAWLKTDTTQPLKKSEPVASTHDEATGSARPLTEASTTADVPKETQQDGAGPSAVSDDPTTTEDVRSVDGEILSPAPVYVEPTQDHHDQIEAVLGQDYDRVLPADAARAAEILAENEGMSPQVAFQQAVAEGAVEQGFLTHQEAVEAYGPEVENVLESVSEGTPRSGSDTEQAGTASEQERPGDAAETGVVSGGSETGSDTAGEGGKRDKPDTKRKAADKPDTSGEAANVGGWVPKDKPFVINVGVRAPAAYQGVRYDTHHYAGHDEAIEAANAFSREKNVLNVRLRKWVGTNKWQNFKKADWFQPTWRPKDIEPEKTKIEDAGEKIGGARKDAWIGRGLGMDDLADMTGAELDKYVTKHNVWKKPDYAQAVEDGVPPLVAALIKRIYDGIAVKPNNGKYSNFSKPEDLRKNYIFALNATREAALAAKTEADIRNLNNVVSKAIAAVGLDQWDGMNTLKQGNARNSPLWISSKDVRWAQQAVAAGFPNAEPWTRLFMVREVTKWDAEKKNYVPDGFNVYRKNGGRIGEKYGTAEEAEAAAKAAYEAMPDDRKTGGEEPKRPHLDNVERNGPDYRKGRDVTGEDFIKDFGFHGVEFGNYVASDERQKVVNLAYDALHDLARVLNLPAKAMSLDGTLSVAFGARGRGGRAAAHYEADRTVINMTKLAGAGSLAHEWAHALDHYLGEQATQNPYKGSVQSISGWRDTPSNPASYWSRTDGYEANRNLKPKLRSAVNRLMDTLFNVYETDDAAEARSQKELEAKKSGQKSWMDRVAQIKARMQKGGSRAGLKQAEDQVEIWGRSIKTFERQIAEGVKKSVPTEFLKQATALSGTTGDYWRRPNELLARSFEAYVFDKIAEAGFSSQYLVQGVEPNRYGSGFKGNPYPTGDERTEINKAYDRLIRAMAVGDGKHGTGTRIQSAEGLPEPVETVTRVKKPAAQPTAKEEAEAVDQSSKPATLADAFEQRFVSGHSFSGILEARKFAKDSGFSEDAKSVEEAIEFAIVRAARKEIEGAASPKAAYRVLVSLYGQQPRLGTRTSTSVRDQAYSTPVPLAYLASYLAGITKDTTVYEPTAGNGALLIGANPKLTIANELNPERAANLKAQGFRVTEKNALDVVMGGTPMDRIITNPPFGPVKVNGESQVFDLSHFQPGYQTHEIDHAIALEALKNMATDGRAVLILGGVNKMVTTVEGRSDAYNGKAKRQFFKTLYDNYNVTDHFTVAGELYERQGAAWPVDVIVIEGRGKSKRPLPAAEVPLIYDSWDSLGGLIDGVRRQEAGDARPNLGPAAATSETGPGVEGRGGRDRADVGSERGRSEQPNEVRNQRGAADDADAGAIGDQERVSAVAGERSARSGEQPAAERPSRGLSADEIGDIFDDILADEVQKDTGAKKPKRDTRSTEDVAKSAAENLTEAADAAMSGLTELFGGGKTFGAGINFDEETYAKAKPMFRAAAEKFAAFKSDIAELMRRMVADLKKAYGWTNDMLAKAKPYMVRFIQDVQAGVVDLNKVADEKPQETKTEAPKAKREQAKAVETENQVTYKPQSKMPGLDTLVPVNMRRSISDALADLETRVGPIDEFVAKELGYSLANKQMEDYFGAEQVDALGLAIDNLKRGKGFIIGDQTGIGKGRVNAAIIRWAILNDRIPMFVTEKPGLYADMFRDLSDIGMGDILPDGPRILATNTGLKLPLDDAGTSKIDNGDSKAHAKLMMSMATTDAKQFFKTHDMVFTNYSQMQTVKGEDTARRQFMEAIAPNAVMIFDESHNAGGQKTRGKAVGPSNRSGFARKLVQTANGVFYSSATYAKRPDVMDLYAATDMAMAVDDLDHLAEAIQRGGVPMQQVVATMLSEGGQYIRRERSFDGITYNTPLVEVNRENYDQISQGLSSIQDLSSYVAKATVGISAQLKAEGQAMGYDGATGDAGASSTSFTAVMHNVISQLLLAMKVEPAAKLAIAALERGEKPVMTVANTMESFLSDYADTLGISPGEEISADFSDVLMKYLDRTRTIIIKKPFVQKGEKSTYRHYLTDGELGSAGVAVYNAAKAQIAGMDLSDLPVSPIDYLKGRLAKAGYKVGEITGRGLVVDYSGAVPVLRNRPGSETTTKGRNATRAKFNKKAKNGGIDAIIINQAGSTGISMHSSRTFDDQSKRHMFIVQAEGNIDTHMQLLGRVNRTGQVVLPEYTQLVANIPAEKRPAAVLSKKMASLNANTTASRSSAVTAKDVPDFINEYGDEVAISYLADNFDMNPRLAFPVKISETGKFDKEDAMRKLTGRIPLLPLKEQEEVYEHLEGEYAALLQQLEAAGENALEAKTLDLKAQSLTRTTVQAERNDSGSPFAAPVVMEKVSIARPGKPYKPHDLMSRISAALSGTAMPDTMDAPTLANMLEQFSSTYTVWGKQAAKAEFDERKAVTDDFNAYTRPILDEQSDPEKRTKELEKFNAVKDRWTTVHELVPIGRRVTLKTASGNLLGIVIGVDQKGTPKNPMALSTWKVTFAVPDATRTMTLPFSRVTEDGKSDPDSILDVEVVPMPQWQEKFTDTLERFSRKQTEAREERYIATGNLLSAYDWLDRKGSILNYTDAKGNIRQGILTSRDFDLADHAVEKGKLLTDVSEIKTWLDANPDRSMTGGEVDIGRENRWSDKYVISTSKAKRKGGVYYLDKPLTDLVGDFYSMSGQMAVTIPPQKLAAALKRLMEVGAKFKVPTIAPKEEKVEDEPMAAMSRQVDPPLTHEAETRKADIQRDIERIVRALVGDTVDLEFNDGLIPYNKSLGWGKLASGQVRGLFFPQSSIIQIALAGTTRDVVSTTFHEAYHAMEFLLQTPQERLLMERETYRLRQIVQEQEGYSDESMKQLSDHEVRAIAFENYATERGSGETRKGAKTQVHIGIRRMFERMTEFLRRVGNALRGLGFRTYHDIFKDAFEGKYRNRQTFGRGEREDPMAAVASGPGGPNSFDNTIGDILGRRISKLLPNAIADRNATEARVQLQDKFIRVKKAEQSVDQQVPNHESAYQAESLYYGRTGQRLEQLEQNHIDPLIAEIKGNGLTIEEVNEDLYARHAQERNERVGAQHPPHHDFNKAIYDTSIVGASGMSTDEANAILRRNAGRAGNFDAVNDRIRDIIKKTRETLLNTGLITQETFDEWNRQYKNYVPLRGFAEGSEHEESIMRAGRGYDIRGKEAKKAFGRKSEADGPLNYILLQAELAIVRGEKNRVGNTFLRFVQSNPDPDQWEVNKPKFIHVIDSNTGLITTMPDNFSDYNDPNVFITKVGGKPYRIRLKGPDGANIARALNNMGTSNLHSFVRMAAVLTHTMAKLATQWNPEFTIPNFARDIGEAFINLQEQQQRSFVTSYAKHILPAMWGSMQAMAGKGANNPYAIAFREFDQAGGRVRFFGLENPDDIKANIDSKMRRLSGGAVNNMRGMMESLGGAVEIINGGIENGTRLATYMAARDVGLSKADSAEIALNVTTNFTRKGELGSGIGAFIMFYNAASQGTARTLKAVQSKYVRRALYTVAAFGAVSAIYGIGAGGDDDDGQSFFSKVPSWDRDKNFIIMWPKGFGHDGQYQKIPVSFGLAGVFHALGSRLAGVLYGKESPGKALMAMLNVVANTFDPTGGDENLVAKAFPSVLRGQVHIETNKNWTGKPLYPDRSWDKSKPDSQQFFQSDSAFSKVAAEKVNQWTGGSKYEPGAIDVHPASIDHWLQTITGGVGRFAKGIADTAGRAARGEEWDATKTPILRRFHGNVNTPQADSAAYYDERNPERTKQEQISRARKDLQQGVNVDESERFIEKNNNAPQANIFKSADKQMGRLRKQEQQITNDKSLPDDEKKAQIKELRGQMREIQNEARKQSRELRQGQ